MSHLARALLIAALSAAVVAASGCQSDSGTCSNGVLDPQESAIDCGGFCGPCGAGKPCESPTDCASLDCAGGLCSAESASCDDGRPNGLESDVDCGGPTCDACGAGRGCAEPTDCASGTCEAGACGALASCSDAALTPGETDVDCGGPCSPCGTNKGCAVHADCLSRTCVFGICKEPTCDDGILNQGEPSVDCGGPCDPCELGQRCDVGTDCASETCEAGACCEANACGFCSAPPPDVCDGVDNDCDGVTDNAEGLTPEACPLQDGVCAGLMATCAGAAGWVCTGADYIAHDARYEEVEVSCDGVDNDCDGVTDEGDDIPNQPMCAKQQGVCAGAVAPCRGEQGTACTDADYVAWDADYQAVETACDHVDNDCDGQTDEGLRNQCGDCAPEPVELCDKIDNDCDGLTDEDPRCAACTATPLAIDDALLPRPKSPIFSFGSAFKMPDGAYCGHFAAWGASEHAAIFFCVVGGSVSVFHRLEENDFNGPEVSFSTGVGEDLVYVRTEDDLPTIHRVTRAGVVTDVTSSFTFAPGHRYQGTGADGSFYLLGFKLDLGSPSTMTLDRLTANGSVTRTDIALPRSTFDSVRILTPLHGGAPTIEYIDNTVVGAATRRFWHGGVVASQQSLPFNHVGSAHRAAQALHFVGGFFNEVGYARWAGGQWQENDDITGGIGEARVVTEPNGDAWILGTTTNGAGASVYRLLELNGVQSATLRAERAAPGVIRQPPTVFVDDDARLHVFHPDEKSVPAEQPTRPWGYYTQICPGFSD